MDSGQYDYFIHQNLLRSYISETLNYLRPMMDANLPVAPSPRNEKNRSGLHFVHNRLKLTLSINTPAWQSWSQLNDQKSKWSLSSLYFQYLLGISFS